MLYDYSSEWVLQRPSQDMHDIDHLSYRSRGLNATPTKIMVVVTAAGFMLLTLMTVCGIVGGFNGCKVTITLSETRSREQTSLRTNRINVYLQPVSQISKYFLVSTWFMLEPRQFTHYCRLQLYLSDAVVIWRANAVLFRPRRIVFCLCTIWVSGVGAYSTLLRQKLGSQSLSM
jgi:hypothetical protein